MSLAPGTRLGVYEVVAAIGHGGMGEVYRARDTELGRQVAIKVLPDAFASDPDRLARFEREAKTLAALNHPNIAQIYGLEKTRPSTGSGQPAIRALVMELVEGPTLADRIAQGPIPLDDALAVSRQIADALEAAHEQGIIHRDLKPANIKTRLDGTVKVLDFGLAKALEPAASDRDASQSPTITSPAMTRMGVILGTAAYMAPEQAKGRPVDRCSDIWAFGCVLYEMLTGTRAFAADDVSDTLAFVLTKEPHWHALPADTPTAIRRLLRRCLQKNARERLHDIRDARLEMQDTEAEAASDRTTVPLPVAGRRSRERVAWTTAALAALIAVAATVAALVPSAGPTAPEMRVAAEALESGTRPMTASICDGSRNSRPRRCAAQRPGPEASEALNPFFSPDGQWIGFRSDRELKKVPVGEAPPSHSARRRFQFSA